MSSALKGKTKRNNEWNKNPSFGFNFTPSSVSILRYSSNFNLLSKWSYVLALTLKKKERLWSSRTQHSIRKLSLQRNPTSLRRSVICLWNSKRQLMCVSHKKPEADQKRTQARNKIHSIKLPLKSQVISTVAPITFNPALLTISCSWLHANVCVKRERNVLPFREFKTFLSEVTLPRVIYTLGSFFPLIYFFSTAAFQPPFNLIVRRAEGQPQVVWQTSK